MPETPSRPRLPFTRRTTLALAPLAVLAGCRWGPAEDGEVVTEQEQDADAELVGTAAAVIDAQLSRLTAVSQAHIGIASALAGLTAAHQAHVQLLGAPSPSAAPSPTPLAVPPSSREALALVRTDEAALQARLASLAGEAVSGPLARALASMSASVAQHVAALPRLPRGPA